MTFNKNLGKAMRDIRLETDALTKKLQTQNLQIDDMHKAIYDKHSRRFEKAMRQVSFLLNISTEGVGFDVMKDVYQGELIPLKDILDEEFEVEVLIEEVVENTIAEGEIVEKEASEEA
ncbi:hypothetical protein V8G54_010466 [Vigna mungo]|uniref:Uncharacterized protein n=1 Tax=Vigna mungo TaxID=3915 RepID=A0AAQ3S335_VIGMU